MSIQFKRDNRAIDRQSSRDVPRMHRKSTAILIVCGPFCPPFLRHVCTSFATELTRRRRSLPELILAAAQKPTTFAAPKPATKPASASGQRSLPT